jgi:uncharacterized protein (DUF1499 family)
MRLAGTPSRNPLAKLALGLAVLAALALLLAGPGARTGLWHFRTGFKILEYAAYAGLAAAGLALVALALRRGGARAMVLALLALAIGAATVVVPWRWRRQARSVPPIHDITTDTERPPEFVAVRPLRADAPNPMEYGGPEIAAQQRAAYPDIVPLRVAMPPAQALAAAADVARELGWEIVAEVPAEGRLEATDRTPWFGFADDVVVRIEADGAESVVHARSLSRVGGSDVGANAERLRAFFARLRERTGGVPLIRG